MTEGYNKRVTLLDVAEILNAVAATPSSRSEPRDEDMPGNFDEWFDGGAVRYSPGMAEYHFKDGTVAAVGMVSWLAVRIRFPDATTITIDESSDRHSVSSTYGDGSIEYFGGEPTTGSEDDDSLDVSIGKSPFK